MGIEGNGSLTAKSMVMMKKKHLIIILFAYLAAIIGIRLAWINSHEKPVQTHAVQGVLDLRDWDFASPRPVTLDGAWEFYPNIFLNPTDSTSAALPQFLQVPGNWKGLFSNTSYHSATYHLRILTNSSQNPSYGLTIGRISSSFELFVNGTSLLRSGTPGDNNEHAQGRDIPHTVFFTSEEDEIDLTIHVSSYNYLPYSGISQSIQLGNSAAITARENLSMNLQFLMCIIVLLHLFYTILLYFIRSRRKIFLQFFLLLLFTLLATVADDDRLLFQWFSFGFKGEILIPFFAYTGMILILLQIIWQIMMNYKNNPSYRWFFKPYYTLFVIIHHTFALTGILYILFAVIAPLPYYFATDIIYTALIYLPMIITTCALLVFVFRGHTENLFLLLTLITLINNLVWGSLKNHNIIGDGYYPFDFILSFLTFAAYWFQRYFRTIDKNTVLTLDLQKAIKSKDDFLANTSHELRTPLHAILNIAQTVTSDRKNSLTPQNKENMDLLLSMGQRMSFMLNDLLDASRLKDHSIVLNLESLSIQATASGVIDMLKYISESKTIRLENNIPDDFPHVLADENRLIQILLNLIYNGIKYTREGSVSVNAFFQNGMAYIHVSDTGIGIDPEAQQRIFLPYEQINSGISSNTGGIGLGLPICKQLIEMHGGSLHLTSVPGEGSTFTFSLPLASSIETSGNQVLPSAPNTSTLAGAVQERIQESTSYPSIAASDEMTVNFDSGLAKPKILAVDDNPLNLKVLSSILSDEKYSLTAVTSGREVLALLGDNSEWDLLIADVMMPELSGYELSRIIRERYSFLELPILLLTARSRSEDILTAFRSGANDYISKPATAAEINARVQSLIGLKYAVEERLNMEAAWMQAQIQPHFLFNTLNSIAVLSEIDPQRMLALLNQFSNYLRSSFSSYNSAKKVPLQQELDLVRSYLYIEKERFGERLNIEWEINENITVALPPLCIQPLVENAVKHGILKRSQGGLVCTRIIDHEDHVVISVSDDGVGMNKEKVEEIFRIPWNKKTGIGLRNTNWRLKQLYGPGLEIESAPDKGTTISFTVIK